MDFIFSIEKAVAASSFLAKEAGGKIDVIYLLKALYLSERRALLTWSRPITGDRFFSLEHGPIMSRIYDMVRERVTGSDMESWSEHFAPRQGNEIVLIKESTLEDLSDREIEVLRQSWNEIKDLNFSDLRQLTHSLPEYEEVGKGARAIDPGTIFEKHGILPEDIFKIESEIAHYQQVRTELA